MTTGVHHVALTGAGCAGKSTVSHRTAELLRDQGRRVLVVDETPTQIIGAGVGDVGLLPTAVRLAVQTEMVRLMWFNHQAFDRIARALSAVENEPVLVIHDQAMPAALAYLAPEAFETLCRELDITSQASFDAYDAVFLLETSALSGSYETASNSARFESPEAAMAVDTALRSIWQRHHSCTRVAWAASMEAKAQAVWGRLASPTSTGHPR